MSKYLCTASALVDGEVVTKEVEVEEWWYKGKLVESIEDTARDRFYSEDLFDKAGLLSLNCTKICDQ